MLVAEPTTLPPLTSLPKSTTILPSSSNAAASVASSNVPASAAPKLITFLTERL